MATLAMSFTVLTILAEEYPKGLTREEVLEKANARDPSRFAGCMGMVDMVLGIGSDGKKQHGLVLCWKFQDGKIVYDESRKSYAPSMEFCGFAEIFNNWLRENNLSHLILYERLTPKNSEKCPYGFEWESVPQPNWCSWSSEDEECSLGCRITRAQFDAKVMRVEGRKATDYKKPHEGD